LNAVHLSVTSVQVRSTVGVKNPRLTRSRNHDHNDRNRDAKPNLQGEGAEHRSVGSMWPRPK